MYNRAIFKTLAFLETEATFKSCWTCKMIMHIHSHGIVRTVYSNVVKDIWNIQGYWRKFSHIFMRWTWEERGDLSCSFWKSKKSALILERKALIMKCLYRRALVPQIFPLPLAKPSILNVWQCSYSELCFFQIYASIVNHIYSGLFSQIQHPV